MAPMTSDDKISFLLCALRHSGKTNWASVGTELSLKPDTAAKRLKYITDGLEKSRAGVAGGSSEVVTPKKKIATPRKKGGSSAKKMKMENGDAMDLGDIGGSDGTEEMETPTAASRKRSRSVAKVNYKEEESDGNSTSSNATSDSEVQSFHDVDEGDFKVEA